MAWQEVNRQFMRQDRPGLVSFWFRESGADAGELLFWLDAVGRPLEIHLSQARWPDGREELLEWRSGGQLRVGLVDSGERLHERGVRYKMSPLVHYYSRPDVRALADLLAYFDDRAAALQFDHRLIVGGLLRSETLKLLARRLIDDLLNSGDATAAGSLLGPDFIDHASPLPGAPDGLLDHLTVLRAAFPDLRYTLELLVAENDRAAVYVTARGTHRGLLLGRPATGRRVIWHEIQILRLGHGRIAERWVTWDRAAVLRQIAL